MITTLAKRGFRRAIRAAGYELTPAPSSVSSADSDPRRFLHPDMEDPFPEHFIRCQPCTMTSAERLYALFLAVRHVEERGIRGSIVECGVWKGGSSMMAALTLIGLGSTARELFLYDTYEGMSTPTELDEKADGSVDTMEKFQSLTRGDTTDWCYAPIDEVRANLFSTGYPQEKMRFIKGKVEDTLPFQAPSRTIALLRLDTDFYESTKCELELLYPLLAEGGVIIIDDYGTWMGARRAVDAYFATPGSRPLLHKIDKTGRIGIKMS